MEGTSSLCGIGASGFGRLRFRIRSPAALAGAVAIVLAVGWRCAIAAPLTVMSYNLYFGADLAPIAGASTPNEFVAAVGAAYANVEATDFNLRAEAIADRILAAQPHFIGLQEVATWQVGGAVTYDYLQILGAALADRGLSYAPVAQIQNLDVQAPGLVGGQVTAVGLTERDVLLARTDLPAGMTFGNAQAQNYSFAVEVPLPGAGPGATIEFRRGWNSVDVTVDGTTVRLVNTHLEPLAEVARVIQAQELLNGPGSTPLPLVLIGDLNTEAAPPAGVAGAAYSALLAAGFLDAVTGAGIGGQATCCQDADLQNAVSALTTRVDHALVRGGLPVLSADIVGDEVLSPTGAGRWPSDHAGVVVTLRVPEPSTALLLLVPAALLVLGRARRQRGAAL
jgi:endonuclease/exonuclease/phosphatase family metal-dependent hydrolase